MEDRNTLVKEAVSQVGSPQILVNMVSMRVRQLGQGFRPLIHASPRMSLLDVALMEVAEGKLAYKPLDDEDLEELAAAEAPASEAEADS